MIKKTFVILWETFYFKETSATWVSYNKNLSEQNFRYLEQYILVKKFPRRS